MILSGVGEIDAGTFGGRVRIARIEAHRGAPDVAAALGYTAQWLYNVEKGKSTPDPETIVRLADELQVDRLWLLAGAKSAASEHVARIRALAEKLGPQRQRELARVAEVMVSEDEAFRARLRASGLDEETIDLVLRAAPSPGPGSEE